MSRLASLACATLATLVLGCWGSPALAGRRISSDPGVPDTTAARRKENRASAWRPLSLWLAFDSGAGFAMRDWGGFRFDGAQLRGGVTLYGLNPRPRNRDWMALVFQQGELVGVFATGTPVPAESLGAAVRPEAQEQNLPYALMSTRFGRDWLLGDEQRPRGYVGLGLGVGGGLHADPFGAGSSSLAAWEAVARVGGYPWRGKHYRVSVGGQGVLAWWRSDFESGTRHELALTVSVETRLFEPRRIAIAD